MVSTVAEFEALVARTDRRPADQAKRIAVLGLFGELGSLVSEFKKKAREGDSYVSFGKTLQEEAGDLLWYFAAISSSLGTSFESLLTDAIGTSISATSSFGEVEVAIASMMMPEGIDHWLVTASAAGRVATALNEPAGDLRGPVVEFLRASLLSLRASYISIATAVAHNAEKTSSRFPVLREPLQLYDDRLRPNGDRIPVDEQLPKKLAVDFEEISIRGKTYVVQKVFQLKIGDPLTDNIVEQDDYRFHDVFHFAFAAVLGWSPVIRALFKLKRKSFPELDENEDGARAILLEEGISTWVFSQSKPHFFEGATGVDYAVLKTIKEFVRGYEVQDQPFWAWEKAILDGYAVFRALRAARRGRVHVDLIDREIRFEPTGSWLS